MHRFAVHFAVCELPHKSVVAGRTGEDPEVENLVGFDNLGDDDRPTEVLGDGTDRITNAADQQGHNETPAEAIPDQVGEYASQPAETQVESQSEKFRDVSQENDFDRDASDGDGPDENQRDPFAAAAEQDAEDWSERSGDKGVNGGMVHALHDGTGGAAEDHHVVDTTHGHQKNVGGSVHETLNVAFRVAPVAAQQAIREVDEYEPTDEMGHRADRVIEAWKGVEIGTSKHG